MIGYFNTYLQRYARSRKQKTYTFLGLSLLLILLFTVLALRPTFLTVIELREKLRQGQEANQKLDQKIQNIEAAQINFENAKPKLDLLNKALPPRPLVLSFMNQVNLLTQVNNLLLIKLQSEKSPWVSTQQNTKNQSPTSPANQKVTPIDFSLEAKGQYEDLKKFILDLQNLLRLVNFKQTSFTKEENSTDLKLALSGQIYFFANANTLK